MHLPMFRGKNYSHMCPNALFLSNRSHDDEAGVPEPVCVNRYIVPSICIALDLKVPATLQGLISIFRVGSLPCLLVANSERAFAHLTDLVHEQPQKCNECKYVGLTLFTTLTFCCDIFNRFCYSRPPKKVSYHLFH